MTSKDLVKEEDHVMWSDILHCNTTNVQNIVSVQTVLIVCTLKNVDHVASTFSEERLVLIQKPKNVNNLYR